MTSGREEKSSLPGHKCPECGRELSVESSTRRRRFSITRGAADNGHTPAANGTPELIEGTLDLEQAVSDRAQTLADHDQTASDHDQTASDHDQTASDHDQTASDHDQTASDRDQESSSEDQVLADRELATGADPVAHRLIRLARNRSSAERQVSSDARNNVADARRQVADERDQIADERDDLADERDRIAESRDREATDEPGLREVPDRGGELLTAEVNRAKAAVDRANAASDRKRAAHDRDQAISLRAAAAQDRAEAVRERNLAGIDQLTGVSLRSIGLSAVEREIQRARRTGRPLTLAFVDVNNLKAVNDTDGHLAGDVLLRRVADMLRMKLRPYDVIVRFGGDEFVCALANTGAEAVKRRFKDIIATLERNGLPHPISFGLTELQEGDDLEHLLERADAALIEGRRLSHHRRP